MKYKKYHILSIALLMVVLIMQEIFDLLSSINNDSSSKINHVYIINFVLLMISFLFIIKGLLQRLRWALIVNIIILSLLVVTNLLEDTYFEFDIFLLSYILLSLIIQRKWFKAKSHFIRLKIGIGLACFFVCCQYYIKCDFYK